MTTLGLFDKSEEDKHIRLRLSRSNDGQSVTVSVVNHDGVAVCRGNLVCIKLSDAGKLFITKCGNVDKGICEVDEDGTIQLVQV